MIAFLEGNILERDSQSLILNVNGVGYQVYLSERTLNQIPNHEKKLALRIHTIVREDALLLYGFLTPLEEKVFKKLITVSGLGPKLAMTILSGLGPSSLAEAIFQEKISVLTAISGVGKKTAERIILELKDKVLDLIEDPSSNLDQKDTLNVKDTSLLEEALSAFKNLGYQSKEAEQVLKKIKGIHELPLDKIVKEGLKQLSNSSLFKG